LKLYEISFFLAAAFLTFTIIHAFSVGAQKKPRTEKLPAVSINKKYGYIDSTAS
jgi:hypothetical protein